VSVASDTFPGRQIPPGSATIKSSRLLTAATLLPILYALIWYLPSFGFFLFISLLIARVQYEFYLLHFPEGRRRPILFGLVLGFFLSSSLYLRLPLPGITFIVLLLIMVLLHTLSVFHDIEYTLEDAAVLFLGIAYLAGFLVHLALIHQVTEGQSWIVLLLIMTWGGDAGAYYAGRGLGKHKLAPRVSPNKTLEGAIGGLVATFLGALGAKLSFMPMLSWGDLIALSLLLGIFGQLGDLVESMMKRSAGVKDSSALVPSHGGLFDKLDSIAFAAPLLYYYLIFVKV